jgi:hypothetical protein
MTRDQTERHVMFASAILLLLIGLTFFVASITQGSPLHTAQPTVRHSARNARCATVQTGAAQKSERACTFRTFDHP